jgi:hypothetical protein
LSVKQRTKGRPKEYFNEIEEKMMLIIENELRVKDACSEERTS